MMSTVVKKLSEEIKEYIERTQLQDGKDIAININSLNLFIANWLLDNNYVITLNQLIRWGLKND